MAKLSFLEHMLHTWTLHTLRKERMRQTNQARRKLHKPGRPLITFTFTKKVMTPVKLEGMPFVEAEETNAREVRIPRTLRVTRPERDETGVMSHRVCIGASKVGKVIKGKGEYSFEPDEVLTRAGIKGFTLRTMKEMREGLTKEIPRGVYMSILDNPIGMDVDLAS